MVKAPRKSEERDTQIEFMKCVRAYEETYPQLLDVFHCPNGGTRNFREAITLKRLGVRPGVPDIICTISMTDTDGIFHPGLALEIKSSIGKLRPEQKEWRDRHIARGWEFHLVRSWPEAWNILVTYLQLPKELIILSAPKVS